MNFMRIAALALTAIFLTGCAHQSKIAPQVSKPMSARLIGSATLPHKMQFQNTVVGGLSGIDYDAATDTFYMLSDDRSDQSAARFYTGKIAFDEKQVSGVTLTSAVRLKQANGQYFPNRKEGGEVPDPEAIRYVPQSKTLLWTSEGDKRLTLSPFIREMQLDGTFIRELPLLQALPNLKMQAPNIEKGPRDNLTFEGMTITPDQSALWVSLEAPLYEDGEPASTLAMSGPTRITLVDLASGKPLRQIAYQSEPIPAAPIPSTGFADNGIPEILAIDAYRLLVLERAYAHGAGNWLRIYEIDTRSGSDTLALPALKGETITPVTKRLVMDFATLGLPRLDNTEGMTWGKRLPNGNRSLILVSDDNFNPQQITQFVVLEISE